MRKKNIVAATVAACVFAAFAATAFAQAATDFDLPRQSLADSLRAVAARTNSNILFDRKLVEGLSAAPLKVHGTAEEALRKLLDGTPLSFRRIDEKTVTIVAGEGPASPEAAEKHSSLEEVVVTGTLIRGVAPASPGTTVTRNEIDKAGFSTVQQILASVPQNYQGSATDQGFTSTGDSAALSNQSNGSSVNLRGLGGDTSLVLVNGRRVAPTMAGHFVDVSMIPVSAIERVEIVTDGASALYGSDAVGGVVNFILRRDYDGMETRVRYGAAGRGGLGEWGASQTLGTAWSSGSVMMIYDFDQRDPLRADQRRFASAAREPNYLIPSQKRSSALLSARQELGERTEIFGDMLYSHRDSDGVVTRNDGTLNSQGSESEQINGTAGVSRRFGETWKAEIGGTIGSNELHYVSIGRSALTGSVPTRSASANEYDLRSADVKADGALFEFPAGDVRLAVGSSFQHEETSARVNGVARVTDGLERNVTAVFGELLVPFVSSRNAIAGIERLELTVAGRYQHYSDFGSTSNPKIGLVYSPARDVTLRGTFSRSFRAPYLENMTTASNTAILYDQPDRAAPDGTTLALFLNGGNPDLKPERSKTWTAGFDIEPASIPSLKVSVTYFDIDYRDRISTLGTAAPTAVQALSANGNLAPFILLNPGAARVSQAIAEAPIFYDFYEKPFSPSDILAIADSRSANSAVTRVGGLDLSAALTTPTAAGAFSYALSASYLTRFDEAIVPSVAANDSLDKVLKPVDLKLRASLTWARSGWTAALFVNYVDSYTDNVNIPSTSISSWTTADLSLACDLGELAPGAFFGGMKVAANVQNVFDRDPPHVSDLLFTSSSGVARGFDPANASPVGRLLSLSVTKRW